MTQVDKTAQKTWNARVTHPLQTWEWGQFRQTMGIDVVRYNGWQLTFHRLPFTPWTIGYFPKGPLPSRSMVAALQELGRKKNAIFIQLEPNAMANRKSHVANLTLLQPSHRPLFTKFTFVLDLTKSQEELLRAMHPKTRYNLKVAQKHDVVVRENNSKTAFDEYLRLHQETTGRQGFYAHNIQYHQTMWRIMRENGIAHLFTATYQGKTLAAWIIFAWGKTLYYPYGTSSREHRDVMAPTLLLWEIARWGKARGYTSFDLWGALGPNPDPKDPWFGFHRFKLGFNPELLELVGSYDLVVRPFLYTLYTIADSFRWFLLKQKARG